MAYTSQIRTWWASYLKVYPDVKMSFLNRDGAKTSTLCYDAWRALEAALQANGYGDAKIVSTFYPRYIGGTTQWSLHSYPGLALDIDPFSLGNPYKKGTRWDFSLTKFTCEQVDAALRIRTNNGYRVWRWGGDFGDYMHWQIDCRPSDIKTGIDWSTVPASELAPGEDLNMGLKDGDEGRTVAAAQAALIEWDPAALPKWGADGDFGSETEEWFQRFQAAHDLIETGSLDIATAFALGTYVAEPI